MARINLSPGGLNPVIALAEDVLAVDRIYIENISFKNWEFTCGNLSSKSSHLHEIVYIPVLKGEDPAPITCLLQRDQSQ